MAMSRYIPSRRSDGPTGPPRGKSQDQRYQEKRDQYGDSRWYGRAGDANPMPWSGPPGQQRGQRAPFFTPDAGDPRNAGYYVPENTSMDASIAAAHQRNRDAYAADPAFAQAKQAGDLKAQIAAMTAAREGQHRQNFIDQGGQGSTYDTRFDQAWPVPGSPSGNYQYGPGRPGPTPPGVAQGGAPMGAPMAAPARVNAGIPTGAAAGGFRRGGGMVGASTGAGEAQSGFLPNPTSQPGSFGARPGAMSLNDLLMGAGSAMPGMGGYNPGASTGASGLYGDPSLYSGGASPMSMQSMGGYFPQLMDAAAAQGRGINPGVVPGMRGPMGGGPAPGGLSDLMSLYGLGAGGMNASPFGMSGFGMGGGGMDGMMRFGGYRPAAAQGMMPAYY